MTSNDPLYDSWRRLDDHPAASAWMLSMYAPKTFAECRERRHPVAPQPIPEEHVEQAERLGEIMKRSRDSRPEREPLLRPPEVAEWLGVPEGTLASWRYMGKGPRFHKMGRHVTYSREDVEEYILQSVRSQT